MIDIPVAIRDAVHLVWWERFECDYSFFFFSNGCDDSLPLAVRFLNVSRFWNLSPVLAIGHFLRAAVSNRTPDLEVPRANIQEKVETVTDFTFLGSKITVDSEYSFESL